MNNIKYLFLLLLVATSCSQYQKALKSEDLGVKSKMATELYEAGKYKKAIGLFEQIAPAVKGKPQGERIFYMYSKSLFNTNQYYTAAYSFESFIANYTRSEKREEASFLGAECLYQMSPVYTLDQTDTYKALEKLQDFIDKYPKSEYLPAANAYVKELNEKLEKKAFENAKQYNTIAEWARDFKSPIITLDNFIADYPGTIYKEDALFYKLDTLYQLAINSVEEKKQERLLAAKSAYQTLIKFKEDTKFRKKADKISETLEKELKQYSNI